MPNILSVLDTLKVA